MEPTPYERAIREQIAFLVAELERVRAERAAEELAADDDSPIGWALRDPNFRQWLLRRQLEQRP
jgi:hypothetical protein